MKKILLPLLMFSFFANAQTPCENGFAGEYPCNGMDLLSFLPNSMFEAGGGNDCWGWTDSLTGKEYALYGNSANTAFVDISDPVNPVYVGKLNSHTAESIWRDIKVYKDYAFIVSEAANHGMQVFDLKRLRNVDVDSMPVIFTEDAHDNSFGGAHNIVINEESGYAYIVGANVYGGGPEFINIQDPLNPVVDGGFFGAGYTHDAQVVNYNGPDQDYKGKEIFFGANERTVAIIDVTDKKNAVIISQFSYPLVRYTHQLWMDDTQQFLFINDELDEKKFGNNTRNIVFDLADLDNPGFLTEYLGKTTAIDHNNYVVDDELYIANYRAGIRVIDIKNIAKADSTISTMKELAFFDTYPEDDLPRFDGAWSVYPFFNSGSIVISDINRGLFIVKKSGATSIVNQDKVNKQYRVYPNPANDFMNLEHNDDKLSRGMIIDILGNVVRKININKINGIRIDLKGLESGLYFLELNGRYIKFIKE